MGYADFALVAYHFGQSHLFAPVWIPITYALALGSNIIIAPFLGYLYDRTGFVVLIIITIIASLFAPCVFLGDAHIAVVGVILWGIGMGAQGSLMRAIVANMVPKEKRALAYGIFNAVFGLFWFIGSALIGILYDTSLIAVVVFSMAAQLLAVPVLWRAII
jgi:MFS family permease